MFGLQIGLCRVISRYICVDRHTPLQRRNPLHVWNGISPYICVERHIPLNFWTDVFPYICVERHLPVHLCWETYPLTFQRHTPLQRRSPLYFHISDYGEGYVCICIFKYICTDIRIYTHTYKDREKEVHKWDCGEGYVCICICRYICVDIRIYTHTYIKREMRGPYMRWMYLCISIYMYKYTYIRTHLYKKRENDFHRWDVCIFIESFFSFYM